MAATELGVKAIHIASQENMIASDIQGTALTATAVPLGSASVRNTTANFVKTSMDWSAYKTIALRVDNTHNQDITLTLQIQGLGDISDINGVPITVLIKANAQRVLVTSKEFPVLGQPLAELVALKATAATAPTSGSIVVTAYTGPYI